MQKKTYTVQLEGPRELDMGAILEAALEYAIAHEKLDAYKFIEH